MSFNRFFRLSKSRRALVLVLGFSFLMLTIGLMLTALEDNIIFFRTPSDLTNAERHSDRVMRLGGLVKEESWQGEGLENKFIITDLEKEVAVVYRGILPDLFRENQGVIAQGRFVDDLFIADTVLAKHDETYMPKEVADQLKKSGKWKEPARDDY